MVHLNKERLQKGIPTKLQMKRMGPCKIIEKYGANAYKVDLSSHLGIFLIFNLQDLVQFKGILPTNATNSQGLQDDLEPIVVPSTNKLDVENILDSRVKKDTQNKVYMEHLFKWKGKPN